MDEQEIRAKSLEIAVMIRGYAVASLSNDGGAIIRQYLPIAEAIEKHIKSMPFETSET